MANLYPIFANPDAPSSFDGLDISVVAGQVTAETQQEFPAGSGIIVPWVSTLNSEQLEFTIEGVPFATLTPFGVTDNVGGTATWSGLIAGGGSGSDKITALIVPPSPNILAVVDRVQVYDTAEDPLFTSELNSGYINIIDNTTSANFYADATNITVSADPGGLLGSVLSQSSLMISETDEGFGLVWSAEVSRTGFSLNDAPSAGATPATLNIDTVSLNMASGTDSLDTVSLSAQGLLITDTTSSTSATLSSASVGGQVTSGLDVISSFSLDGATGLLATDNSDPANPLSVDVNPLGFTLSSGDGSVLSMTLDTTALTVNGVDNVGFVHSQTAVSGTNNVLTYSLGGDGLSFSDITDPVVTSSVTLASNTGLTILQDTNGVYLTPTSLLMEAPTTSGTYYPNGLETTDAYTMTIGADADTLVLPSDGLIYTGVTGGISGDNLKVTINGTDYYIALLSAVTPP